MTIKEALQIEDTKKRIEALKKQKNFTPPNIDELRKQWDPVKHDIMDVTIRKDKEIRTPRVNDAGEEVEGGDIVSYQSVTRVALAFQKLIVKKAAMFLFGNPVKVKSSDEESIVTDAVNKILKDNKINSFNSAIARILFSSTEVAEYWYGVKVDENEKYGYKSSTKFKVRVFSPLDGDLLYPFFNEAGEMVAFSRQYKVIEPSPLWYLAGTDVEVTYFETWTAEQYVRYKQVGSNWEVVKFGEEQAEFVPNKTGKIPIIYGNQSQQEWYDAENLIENLEKIMSDLGETNAYNASPMTLLTGDLTGSLPGKGGGGRIFMGSEKSDIKVVSWAQAPESVKLEIEMQLKFIYSLTQTPDISFESLKGLGNSLSGEGMKVLLFDAHLKAKEHMEVFEEYIQRRLNLLKAFVGKNGQIEKEADALELTPIFTLYMPNDTTTTIQNVNAAVSGGLLSQQTGSAIAAAAITGVDDAQNEMDLIKTEQAEADKREISKQNALNDQFNNI